MKPLTRDQLLSDPIEQFRVWFEDVRRAGAPMPEAMTLATADASGQPDARMVLLKGVEDGFVFFTNFESKKGADLKANPKAALVFWWIELRRQVRVAGRVVQLAADQSDGYFLTRDRGSRLGAWASPQSRPLADRKTLISRFAHVEKEYPEGIVPRPPFWGGYKVIPHRIEFWQEQPSRLHDRFEYRADHSGGWSIQRLAP